MAASAEHWAGTLCVFCRDLSFARVRWHAAPPPVGKSQRLLRSAPSLAHSTRRNAKEEGVCMRKRTNPSRVEVGGVQPFHAAAAVAPDTSPDTGAQRTSRRGAARKGRTLPGSACATQELRRRTDRRAHTQAGEEDLCTGMLSTHAVPNGGTREAEKGEKGLAGPAGHHGCVGSWGTPLRLCRTHTTTHAQQHKGEQGRGQAGVLMMRSVDAPPRPHRHKSELKMRVRHAFSSLYRGHRSSSSSPEFAKDCHADVLRSAAPHTRPFRCQRGYNSMRKQTTSYKMRNAGRGEGGGSRWLPEGGYGRLLAAPFFAHQRARGVRAHRPPTPSPAGQSV